MDSKDAKRWHVMYVCCKQCTHSGHHLTETFCPHFPPLSLNKMNNMVVQSRWYCPVCTTCTMGIEPLSKPDDTNSASRSQLFNFAEVILTFMKWFIYCQVSFEFNLYEELFEFSPFGQCFWPLNRLLNSLHLIFVPAPFTKK